MSNLQISLALFSIAGITLCWLFLQLRPGARERRHARLQEKARRVLIKINTIPNMPQRLAYLRKIDPLAFEELLLETFERRGFKVTRNTHYSGDGGVDGIVTLHGERFLVQAKRYGKHIRATIFENSPVCWIKIIAGVSSATPGGQVRPAKIFSIRIDV